MNSAHVIARCSWLSAFDQQARAHELQNFISSWSNEVLPRELERCFDEICPATQTWRIDALHLDVGDIPLADLPDELPARLRESLRTKLAHLLAKLQAPHTSNDDEHLQVTNATELLQEFVIWFLQNGTAPWWFKGSQSAMQILDKQLENHQLSTTEIIRDLGRSRIVRQRIVRQCGEPGVRRIIHCLEPWHGDFICTFADNLFVAQAQRKIPRTGASEYREHTWLNILTYLLVDRGSLFNTTAFVRANLWQTAQHYRLDYHELLEQMFQAAQALEPLGLVAPAFLSSIKMIYTQGRGSSTAQHEDAQTPDPWSILQKMLHYGHERHTIAAESVRADELFASLAREDAARMAMLLRAEGKSASVRQGIVTHFAFDELALLVQLLEPQNQPFIVAYVRQTQTLAELRHWDKKKIWQVVLAYLLAERSSHFNRQQMVFETLLRLSKQHKIEIVSLLDLLIRILHESHASARYFELLDIFHTLKTDQEKRHPPAKTSGVYWKVLHYLQTGERDSARNNQGLGVVALNFGHLKLLANERSLNDLLQSAARNAAHAGLLCQRLLKLAGPAEVALLFDLIEPGSADFCMALLKQIATWHKQNLIPALGNVDLAFQLPALMIEALPGLRGNLSGRRGGFDLADYWINLSRLLPQRARVHIPSLHLQLQQCLEQADEVATPAGLSELLLLLVGANRAVMTATAPEELNKNLASGEEKDTPWSSQQLFNALRFHLTAVSTPTTETTPQIMPSQALDLPMRELLKRVEKLDGAAIQAWLAAQPDKHHLLAKLGRAHHLQAFQHGLALQLPAQLVTPDETLKQLSQLFQKSGQWHGATAVLEQTLREVFWTVSLDVDSKKMSASAWLAALMTNACVRLDMPLSACLESVTQQPHLLQKTHWRDAYGLISKRAGHADQTVASHEPKLQKTRTRIGNTHALNDVEFRQDLSGNYLDHPKLISIARHLLQQGRPPAWLTGQAIDINRLLFDVFSFKPNLLPELLKGWQRKPEMMFRLFHSVPFSWLLDALRATVPNQQSILMLQQFQQLMGQITLPGSSRPQRLAILFQLALKHWLKQDWAALAPEQFIARFFWQLMRSQPIARTVLQKVLAPELVKQPGPIRLELEKVMGLDQVEIAMPNACPAKKKWAAALKVLQQPQPETAPMPVFNCGLVLLQSFIPMLFSRLGLAENHQFVTHSAQRRAVHFLQFLVTGCRATAEEHLALNKLLCGLALHEPVESTIEISAEEEAVCQSLLHAVIGYWDAIGESSIQGLQGNWLVRKGSLHHAGDHWDLIVEKRVYDLLLARAPFSYSVIKFPWMETAIYVTWPT